jgi:hypothetical protein
MEVEEIKDEIVRKDKSKFLTFLFFLLISSLLWFLIKLSKEYTTQTSFMVVYTDAPVNKWVSTTEQRVNLSFIADGFVTLRHNLVREPNRVVEISLEEVPYRLEGGNTYSYGSQYVAERVADWLGVPSGNVTVNDDKQFFNMEDLQQKELPVRVPLDVKTQRQYVVYGNPEVTPATITVYGPKSVLDTMKAIKTAVFHATGANADLMAALPIDFCDGAVRGTEASVQVKVQVEQFTETIVEVPVTVKDPLHVRFFPETISVKCVVPIRDYPNLSPSSFRVVADTAQLHRRQPLLDIHLVEVPEHVVVVKTKPEQVEYLIVN